MAESSPVPVFYLCNRGGKQLAYKGFQYGKDKEIENKIYWKCQNRSCTGRGRDYFRFSSFQSLYQIFLFFDENSANEANIQVLKVVLKSEVDFSKNLTFFF